MNRGDTLDILLAYTVDGEPIHEGDFDEIEFSIGAKRYTLTDGDITWDEEQGYIISIGQEDTLDMGRAEYQVRFKKGSKVISSSVNTLTLGKSISKTVI